MSIHGCKINLRVTSGFDLGKAKFSFHAFFQAFTHVIQFKSCQKIFRVLLESKCYFFTYFIV